MSRVRPEVPEELLKSVVIHLKVTQKIKDKIDDYCEEYGLTMSEAIRIAIAEKVNKK